MAGPRRTRSTTSTSGRGRTSAKTQQESQAEDLTEFRRYTGWRSLLNPLWCYYGFRVAVLVLACFGVIMVFSSSSVDMVSQGASPWSQAISQGVYCVIGLLVAMFAMMVPSGYYHKSLGVIGIGVAIVLQALTLTPLGISQYGNTGWIGIEGVFTIQPAEVMKLALCIWLPKAMIDARKQRKRDGMKAYIHPGIIYFICLALVMAGRDMGTGMIIVGIGLVAFLIGGFPLKWMAIGGGVVALAAAAFVIASPNRLNRVLAAYTACTGADAQDVCYQSIHARYAIASGGLLGVGIGNSREKWNYLPAAHNDFIFAIICEETGFIGGALVILLFVVIGWCLIAMAMQSRNRYASMVMVCIACWLVGQGLVNIAVVVGLLPVMGVPMPFVSAGGSSLIMCLGAAGVAASMMREHPQVKAERVRA